MDKPAIRIVTLNTWGGTLFGPLIDFVIRESQHTDIFCFQEVFSSSMSKEHHGRRMNLLQELQQVLPNFASIYEPTVHNRDSFGPVDFDLAFGNATFVRRGFVFTKDVVPLYEGFDPKSLGNNPKSMITVSLTNPDICVGNVHGLWVGPKDDTPERIEQSRRILDAMTQQPKPVVLVGDFNVRPETESIAMLSAKYTNLIAAFNITNTRTPHYKDMEKFRDYIADYVFVSPEFVVTEFSVLDDVVSDHRAIVVAGTST